MNYELVENLPGKQYVAQNQIFYLPKKFNANSILLINVMTPDRSRSSLKISL